MDIIATIGPKSIDKWVLKDLIENGVSIIRLNCSHFNKDDFEYVIKHAREISDNVKILVDLSGKKIRVSNLLKRIYKIYDNEIVYFCPEDLYESLDLSKFKESKVIPLTASKDEILNSNITSISIKDNTMTFEIINIDKGMIEAKVTRGGIVRASKGCNLSGIYNNRDSLSVKDKDNIIWALNNDVDILCQSFVECGQDIKKIKEFIKNNNKNCNIWAKVETPKGVENLDEVLEEVDSVVIGRGDLVPESGILRAIELQDTTISKVKKENKKVIIATHLLSSMRNANLATLPEVESIRYFLKNNVDGFLLASETSVGLLPVKTVKFLKDVISYYR